MKRILMTGLCIWAMTMVIPAAMLVLHPVKAQPQPTVQAATASESTETAEPAVTASISKQPIESETDSAIGVTVQTEDGVREMDLRTYVLGVLAGEMPADFPQAALEAQAIAARTHAVYRMQQAADGNPAHESAILCDDPSHCAAWCDADTLAAMSSTARSALEAAVDATDGQYLTYDGEPIVAAFHSVSGGRTEAAVDVWGSDVAYLQSVSSPGEEDAPRFTSEKRISAAEFREIFRNRYSAASLDDAPDTWFQNIVRSEGGAIQSVSVGGVQVTGRELRSLLSLDSADFTVTAEVDTLLFTCTGFGHGVGMSQYGARAMALEGADAEAILTHYYTGAILTRLSIDETAKS